MLSSSQQLPSGSGQALLEEEQVIIEGYAHMDTDEMEILESSYPLEEEERGGSDGDPFGGMQVQLYNDIVEFKRTGRYPSYVSTKSDRSAHSHWRHRCSRYTLADDNETLLYFNPHSTVYDHPKVVVQKGEVRKVLERIHELIGHLGQKRTQIVVLKKLFWRSVRQDVKMYIEMCEFCQQKKVEGKRITKAPIDVMKEDFNLAISITHKDATNGDRFEFNLVGYNETAIKQAAFDKMTSYTFKETQRTQRQRSTRVKASKRSHSTAFDTSAQEEQNIVQNSTPTSFVVEEEFDQTNPEHIYVVKQSLPNPNNTAQSVEEELVEVIQQEEAPSISQRHSEVDENDLKTMNGLPAEEVNDITVIHRPEYMIRKIVPKREKLVKRTNHQQVASTSGLQNADSLGINSAQQEKSALQDIAFKYAQAVSEIITDRNSTDPQHLQMLSSYDGIQTQPEMLGLAPILMLPSTDREVTALQKELLTRQLALQKLQEKVLRAQYAQYSQMMTNGEDMHEEVLEEEVVEVDDMNVLDDVPHQAAHEDPSSSLYGKRTRIFVENGTAAGGHLQEPHLDIE